jgi:hypothetical protein
MPLASGPSAKSRARAALEIFEEALTGTGRAAPADDSDSTESGSIALQLDGRKRDRMGPEEMEAVATRTLAAVRLRRATAALRIADRVRNSGQRARRRGGGGGWMPTCRARWAWCSRAPGQPWSSRSTWTAAAVRSLLVGPCVVAHCLHCRRVLASGGGNRPWCRSRLRDRGCSAPGVAAVCSSKCPARGGFAARATTGRALADMRSA